MYSHLIFMVEKLMVKLLILDQLITVILVLILQCYLILNLQTTYLTNI